MPLQLVLTGTHKEGMDVAKGAAATVEEQVASPRLASHWRHPAPCSRRARCGPGAPAQPGKRLSGAEPRAPWPRALA